MSIGCIFLLLFFFFYNHIMSFKHHVGVQYVLQYCNYYRSTFGIKKFYFSFLKKGCVLQCIAVTNKELWYVHKIKNIPFYSICNCTATFLKKNVDNNVTFISFYFQDTISYILFYYVTPDPNAWLLNKKVKKKKINSKENKIWLNKLHVFTPKKELWVL